MRRSLSLATEPAELGTGRPPSSSGRRPRSFDRARAGRRRRPARRLRPGPVQPVFEPLRMSGPASGWLRSTAMAWAGAACSSCQPLAPVADQQPLELGMLARLSCAGHGRVDQRPEAVGQGHGASGRASAVDPLAAAGEQDRRQAARPRASRRAAGASDSRPATATAPAPAGGARSGRAASIGSTLTRIGGRSSERLSHPCGAGSL